MNIGFISLGCSKNLVDTEIMIGLVKEAGHSIVPDPALADIIIINTCGFIESAKEESINTILEMARYNKKIIVAGCMAERYKDEILKEMPEVDAVIGVNSFQKIAEAIKRLNEGPFVLCGKEDAPDLEGLPRVTSTPPHTAYLKIAEGCSNNCTYCAIPSIRGPYRSRSEEAVINEAKTLAERGVKELIVIAQDTTRYGIDLYGEARLPSLLKRLCEIDKIKWVRVHYCYPEDITDELLEVIRTERKICRYLDIPIQHINNKILKRMGRRGTGGEIRALIKKIRELIPGVTLRTSLIVGFPGEGEEEFGELFDFVAEARFDRLGVFAYSQEEGTPAAKLPEQVDEKVKLRRRDKIMRLQRNIAKDLAREKRGSTLTVLVEGQRGGHYIGRSEADSLQVDPVVRFKAKSPPPIGELVKVHITGFDEYDLIGEMLNEYPE